MSDISPITPAHGWHVGEDFEFVWLIDNGTPPAGMGTWVVEFRLLTKQDEGSVVLTITDPALTINATDSTITVPVTRAQTKDLPNGDYYYYLARVVPYRVLAEGAASLLAPVILDAVP